MSYNKTSLTNAERSEATTTSHSTLHTSNFLSLPQSTECKKILPKHALFTQFGFTTAQKKDFDTSFSRLTIVHEVTPHTTHMIKGPNEDSVSGFFVIHVQLKCKDYDSKILAHLAKKLPHKVLFLLEYEDKACIAVYHTAFFHTPWTELTELTVTLNGVDFDTAWSNIVQEVGAFTVEEESIEAQITINAKRLKLEKDIARLEKKARTECQPRKKLELVERLQALRAQLDNG